MRPTPGTVGHVDHGKTTLTAAITGHELRVFVGDPKLSVVHNEGQERILQAVRDKGLNPDRLYFIGEAIVYDSHGDDASYDRAEREAVILRELRSRPVEDERPSFSHRQDWNEQYVPFHAPMSADRRGKQGKNKSTRRFDLPPRRL